MTDCSYRSKLQRDKERDISEQIALGLASAPPSQEAMFDQRLFNQSKVSHYSLCHNYASFSYYFKGISRWRVQRCTPPSPSNWLAALLYPYKWFYNICCIICNVLSVVQVVLLPGHPLITSFLNDSPPSKEDPESAAVSLSPHPHPPTCLPIQLYLVHNPPPSTTLWHSCVLSVRAWTPDSLEMMMDTMCTTRPGDERAAQLMQSIGRARMWTAMFMEMIWKNWFKQAGN